MIEINQNLIIYKIQNKQIELKLMHKNRLFTLIFLFLFLLLFFSKLNITKLDLMEYRRFESSLHNLLICHFLFVIF